MVRFHSEPPFFIVISIHALVAQLDRVFGYEPKGQGFESLRAHHFLVHREVAQFGRALGLGPRGCRFKSCLPDHFLFNKQRKLLFLCKKKEAYASVSSISSFIELQYEHLACPPKGMSTSAPHLVQLTDI